MRILFITNGKYPDYLNDCLYHGLKSLPEVEVYTTAPMWFMYDDITVETKASLYGKGFTVFGRLAAEKKSKVFGKLDSFRLRRRIRERFFDIVIYGSIWRCQNLMTYVSRYYPREKILLVDGEDHSRINNLQHLGLYFKRENTTRPEEPIHPIAFGVPEELVLGAVPAKEKFWASVIPGNLTTYIFDRESDYYADYQESRFGITTKKGGWDCLRHYEIMMNGCVPYFPFIEDCPPKTMANFPKAELAKSRTFVDRSVWNSGRYDEMANFYLDHTRKNLTTVALARYVLSFT